MSEPDFSETMESSIVRRDGGVFKLSQPEERETRDDSAVDDSLVALFGAVEIFSVHWERMLRAEDGANAVDVLIWDAWRLAPTTRDELRSLTIVYLRYIAAVEKAGY